MKRVYFWWIGLILTVSFGLVPMCGALEITTTALPVGVELTPYSETLSAANGMPPYTWSAASMAYSEFGSPTAFSEIGEAQGWQADEGSWSLELPFEFLFYGEIRTTVYISSNGTITFDDYFYNWSPSLSEFKQYSMIAPLWADLNTRAGDIYIESSSERVLIRWQGSYYYDSPAVNFSVALNADGTIEFLYGSGNSRGGFIGISAGDGENYILDELSQSGSLDHASSVQFDYGPYGAALLPAGLTLSSDGVLSGIPTEIGTHDIAVRAVDATSASVSKFLVLEVLQNPNARPVISDVTPLLGLVRIAKGASQMFTVSASDSETSALTYIWALDGEVVSGNGASYTYVREEYDNRIHVLRCTVQDDFWTDQVFAVWYIEPAPTPGTVAGWGASAQGRTETPYGLTGVVKVSSGMNHNLALKTDGTVVAWGYNGYGQADVPEGLADVVAVEASGFNSVGVSFAVKSDGSVVGWGKSYEEYTYWDNYRYWDSDLGEMILAATTTMDSTMFLRGLPMLSRWQQGQLTVLP